MTLAAIAYADRKEILNLLANQQFATQGRWQLQWLGMDEVTGAQSRWRLGFGPRTVSAPAGFSRAIGARFRP